MSDDPGDTDGGRRRGAFLGFVAHEVRNPLSTALWSAELLSRMTPEDRGGPRGEKLAGMCMRSISRVRQLVEDHFLCERLDAGGLALRLEPVSARELGDGLLERRVGQGAELTLDLPEDVAALADRNLLERAVESLVVVAGRDGTPVRVRARREDAVTILEVVGKPPGPGALQDPAKGTPSDQTGRALALPLVRRVAAALGGSVTVTQEGYLLSLPRAEAYAPPPPKPATPP